MNYTEDSLEKALIDILINELNYNHLYGPEISPEETTEYRTNYNETILYPLLTEKLYQINPEIPAESIKEAIKKIQTIAQPSLIQTNHKFHKYLIEGIDVTCKTKDGSSRTQKVYIIDEKNPENNDFTVINQFTIIENKNRRPDLVIFVNGIPLIVFELKTESDQNITIKEAYNQIQTYKQDIPTLFYTNSIIIISDGIIAKAGTITSDYNRYSNWKSINGEKPENSPVQIIPLLKGMLQKSRLIEIIVNFSMFQNETDGNIKILSAYHQYFAVKKALTCTQNALLKDKKAGIIWHTQGSGKSFSMVFYTRHLSKYLNNPTIVVLTDRNDLDGQLFTTFSKSKEYLRQTPIQITDRKDLRQKLNRASGGIIFTTIQKFTPGEDEDRIPEISPREDIILIVDEAHRSQYGLDAKIDKNTGKISYGYAKHVRDALPNATFIGFTGTPIDKKDKSTVAIFGDYIDVYDMTQSIEDGATVKIYYENRIAKISINDKALYDIDREYELAAAEGTDDDLINKSKKHFTKLKTLIGDEHRLEMIASDIVFYYEDRAKISQEKAMIVCMDRDIASRLYSQIIKIRPDWHSDKLEQGKIKVVMTTNPSDNDELKKHSTTKQDRETLAKRIKDINDDLKIVIVVDMWLTGFDAPALTTMFLDKPLQSHNLMQAIARVNRVFEGKKGGLVVDYFGIMSELRQALSEYTDRDKDKIELDLDGAYNKLKENLEKLRDLFHGFDYKKFTSGTDLERLHLIGQGIEHILKIDHEENGLKNEYVRITNELTAAETLCRTMLDDKTKIEISYFKAIKSGLIKMESSGRTLEQINEKVTELLKNSIQKEEIINLSDILGIKKIEIDIFNEDFFEEIKKMKHKNIALKLLEKLLSGKIKGLKHKNIVQSEKFSEKFKEVFNRYNNKSITNAEIIEELLKMSKELKQWFEDGKKLGLSQEEVAFYDAITKFDTVKEVYKEDILKEMAKELTEIIRKSKTIDWEIKKSVRAKMRMAVKKLLKKYKYPPEHMKNALEIVIQQAEVMRENM
jgi:type I restriction enzyme R subunit